MRHFYPATGTLTNEASAENACILYLARGKNI